MKVRSIAVLGKKPLRGLAICLLWAGLFVDIVSVFGTLPFFAAGATADAEGAVVLFYAAATLSFTGLALFAVASPAAARFLLHPLVLVCSALGIWSLIGAAFADFPMLALLGAPQTGEGAIWFFALGAFIASAMILRRDARLFGSLVTAATGTGFIVAFINLANIPSAWRIAPWLLFETTFFSFNEYLGYYAIGLLALSGVWLGRRPSRQGFVLFACGIVVLLVSRNRVAMGAAGIATITLLALFKTPYGRQVVAWLAARGQVVDRSVAAALVVTAAFPVFLLRLVDFHGRAFSLWSREVLMKVLDPSLFESVRAVVFGHGWGHYAEYLTRNLPSAGIGLFKTEWGDIGRDEFHSHNGLVEALFSTGVPGLLLAAAFPVVLALTSQRRWRALAVGFAFAWTAVDAMWFPTPVALALLALAAGAMAETSARPKLPRLPTFQAARLRLPAIGVCIVLAEIACLAAFSLRANGLAMQRLEACVPPSVYQADCDRLAVPRDPRGADFGLAKTVDLGMRRAMRNNEGGDLPDAQKAFMQRLFGEASKRSAGGSSATLSLILANTSASAAFIKNGEQLLPDGDTLQSLWPRQIYDTLDRAPLRLDILPTYFNWLLLQKNSDDARTMLAFAENIDPHHPVVLWYEGVLLLGSQDTTVRGQGLDLMRKALGAGIERFMPVSDKIKTALEKSNAP
ncbi:MAG TPA: hypothetical protein VF449_05520 [Parvibaculum sp.]